MMMMMIMMMMTSIVTTQPFSVASKICYYSYGIFHCLAGNSTIMLSTVHHYSACKVFISSPTDVNNDTYPIPALHQRISTLL